MTFSTSLDVETLFLLKNKNHDPPILLYGHLYSNGNILHGETKYFINKILTKIRNYKYHKVQGIEIEFNN